MLLGMTLATAMIFVWIGVAIVALIIELNTTDLSSIWATIGGFAAMIVAIFCDIIWVQILVFMVVTLIGIIFIRKFVKRYVRRNEVATNSDALVGKVAIVVDEITNGLVGAVNIDGKEWSAVAKDSTATIEKGSKVEILSIEGVKLVVKEKKEGEQ